MSLAIVHSRARVGMDAPKVTVEVHLSPGLPGLSIVGLPEAAVRESKDRVRSALINASFEFPARRITINLAPADLPKEGGRYDLAIALGVLAASGQIPAESLKNKEFYGELALSGELRPITGLLPAAVACAREGHDLFVPQDNAKEANLPSEANVFAASHLLQVCAHLNGAERLAQVYASTTEVKPRPNAPDLKDVKAQHQAKRALEIAAAGGHSLLMVGPPGTGKTMLASRLPSILPPLTEEEALEVAAIRSISGQNVERTIEQWQNRPFRSPHHTASGVALVGGGSQPKPGEISLAHCGILFLDELPEFDRKVLEVLREPLESGEIMISRAAQQACFPARFQLITAMNPCPCGYAGDSSGRCHCTPEQINRYRMKLSGPLLDRIDMHIKVPAIAPSTLRSISGESESSQTVQERVIIARTQQLERQNKANFLLQGSEIENHCALSEEQHQLLEKAAEQL
ncbi:MAG: YifB family Mg chelatase-like AAA ATPase, partial [Pseudomonadales bacterium]|nr:YifB family Mg chelatase-like AAA ATPase [Pseudomonadales bacterium]